jgi:hypothetical protein
MRVWIDVIDGQVSNAIGQGVGLARSGPSDDEQRWARALALPPTPTACRCWILNLAGRRETFMSSRKFRGTNQP